METGEREKSDEYSLGEYHEQAGYLGKRVIILPKYSPRVEVEAEVVRDDKGGKGLMIFRLADGKHLLNTEVVRYGLKNI